MTNQIERKYEIQQVSGTSRAFVEVAGFIERRGVGDISYFPTSFGAIPVEGKIFYAYYTGCDTEEGLFKIVRKDGDLEFLIDKGKATESHFHGGLGTLTFYGKGERMNSWSIHCKPKEIK